MWHRERKAGITSKVGFSVVEPIIVIVPFSTYGRIASCWALLKRCTSSMKRIVCRLWSFKSSRACSTTRRKSATPALTALSSTKLRLVTREMMRARVVFPEPGGPQKIMETTTSFWISLRRGLPSPIKCSCPTNSSSVVGRTRSASGAIFSCRSFRWTSKRSI